MRVVELYNPYNTLVASVGCRVWDETHHLFPGRMQVMPNWQVDSCVFGESFRVPKPTKEYKTHLCNPYRTEEPV